MSQYEHLKIPQGSDVAIQVQLLNRNKSKKNLSDHTVQAKMSPSYYSSDSDKIPFVASVVDPADDGIILLTLSNQVTDNLNPKTKYVYDVEISFQDSDQNTIIQRVLEGSIEVSPSVT